MKRIWKLQPNKTHIAGVLPIPEYQTQTALVSHTQLLWHNPKLLLSNRNPSIGFNTFQSRAKLLIFIIFVADHSRKESFDLRSCLAWEEAGNITEQHIPILKG